MSPLRNKALAILRTGRVRLLSVKSDDSHTVIEALAKVKSSRPGERYYATEFLDGAWDCTCGRPGCAHIAAVQLVTGHPSEAAA